ncbi:MAG: alkaline phosphatase family protein [Clostridiales bacterium]|nr:alkaline phosphatase family protein [Clostridiales bacterium]
MNKKIFYPDYARNIVNIPNSLAKYFHAETKGATLPLLDASLSGGYKNVVLLIMDGMGSEMLKKHIPDGFLSSHKKTDLSSVFPSTTTAALTSLCSGLTPAEHGWMGWSCYFNDLNICVDLFNNKDSFTGKHIGKPHLASSRMPYRDIWNDFDVKSHVVSPFSKYKIRSLKQLCRVAARLCKKRGKKFIYSYFDNPDAIAHVHGTDSLNLKTALKKYDDLIARFAKKVKNTLVIITADHGLTDAKLYDAEDYPDITECLYAKPSLEPRALSFFVKPEFLSVFPERFKAAFGDAFILKSGKEFLDEKFSGIGNPHPETLNFVGDYMALAVGDIALSSKNQNGFIYDYKANHSGLTEEEMLVPLILVENRE